MVPIQKKKNKTNLCLGSDLNFYYTIVRVLILNHLMNITIITKCSQPYQPTKTERDKKKNNFKVFLYGRAYNLSGCSF